MLAPLLQRADIERICAERRITLDGLANDLLYVQCHGVPSDALPLVNRAWRLVSEMLDERQEREFAAHYVADENCPRCHVPPRLTGGRHPRLYCPVCEAVCISTVQRNGQTYRRWYVRSDN